MALKDNIVSYWTLDAPVTTTGASGVQDSSGNANHGTENAAISSATGLRNTCLQFNGSSNYVSGSNSTISGGAFTISAWVWLTAVTGSDVYFSMGTVLSSDLNIHLRLNSATTMTFGLYLDDLNVTLPTDVTLGWTHIVATLDASKVQRVYQNGVVNATTHTTGAFFSGSNTWNIGRWNLTGAGGSYWTGYVDEVGIWSRALSDAEVSTLYSLGKGIQYPFASANFKNKNTLRPRAFGPGLAR